MKKEEREEKELEGKKEGGRTELLADEQKMKTIARASLGGTAGTSTFFGFGRRTTACSPYPGGGSRKCIGRVLEERSRESTTKHHPDEKKVPSPRASPLNPNEKKKTYQKEIF